MVGFVATIVGLTVKSIYALFLLCSDLVFVILFPQLVGAVHIQDVNTYGSVAAYIIGLFLRITGGEKLIGFPAAFKYPWYDEETESQNFPFRLLAMIISFITLLLVSKLFYYLFDNEILDESRDVFGVIKRRRRFAEVAAKRRNDDNIPLQEKYEGFEDPALQKI